MKTIKFYFAGRPVVFRTRAKTFFGLLRARRKALAKAKEEFFTYCEICEVEELMSME